MQELGHALAIVHGVVVPDERHAAQLTGDALEVRGREFPRTHLLSGPEHLDFRVQQFAETFQIPSFDVFSGRDFKLESYWDQSLFDRFNRAYHHTYREMRTFLVENGVDTKMVDVMSPVPEQALKVA